MTLSLSEVQAIRFPIARRGTDGYRAAEVDDFVDKVVDTFTVLADDNERLKATVEALQNGRTRAMIAEKSAALDNDQDAVLDDEDLDEDSTELDDDLLEDSDDDGDVSLDDIADVAEPEED